MHFLKIFFSRIEDFDYTKEYIEAESKLLSKKIKTRINFHNIFDFYFHNNNSIELYNDYSFHLFNIFLKFIQENYQEKKYNLQVKFIIRLFADFIEAKPKILKIPKNVDLNHFFTQKIEKLENVCLIYCQVIKFFNCKKLFLNNGTIEIFLKIITENNNYFNQSIFPTILKVFNNILRVKLYY